MTQRQGGISSFRKSRSSPPVVLRCVCARARTMNLYAAVSDAQARQHTGVIRVPPVIRMVIRVLSNKLPALLGNIDSARKRAYASAAVRCSFVARAKG